MKNLNIKRIYEEPSTNDGIRILVDRLWPRGISKQRAHLDYWYKDIAPSPGLRKWFDHKEDRFSEFSKKYWEELQNNAEIKNIISFLKTNHVTLIYAAKSPLINHAIVLKNFIDYQRQNF